MIRSIQIQNFRSIRDVTLSDLGPHVIFYGPNGAGKSNILAAMARAFQLIGEVRNAGKRMWDTKVLSVYDFRHKESYARFCVNISQDKPLFSMAGWGPDSLRMVFRVRRKDDGNYEMMVEDLWMYDSVNRTQAEAALILDGAGIHVGGKRIIAPGENDKIDVLLNAVRQVGLNYFMLISAIREAGPSHVSKELPGPGRYQQHISRLLWEGRVTEALVVASNSPDPKIRRGFRRLQELFEGEPLRRPHAEPVHDMLKQEYDLQEVQEGPGGELQVVSVGSQGLGVQQLYVILGSILLGDCVVAAIEEPEAHLHAPSSGRDLRELLRRVVDEGHVQQLFIATHSNLFDLDPKGWFDVSLVDGETRVERRSDWAEVDRRHLYEPGPARHALLDLLRYLPEDTPVFRRASGEPVTGPEMVQMLIDDDPVVRGRPMWALPRF